MRKEKKLLFPNYFRAKLTNENEEGPEILNYWQILTRVTDCSRIK